MRMKVVLSHLALRALGVSVEELRHVGHDGLLVRPLHVHVLRVQQPKVASSVGDPDPQDPHDPNVFGPPVSGSGSISQKSGSGSFPFPEIMLAKQV
jgi:hypothetical protein